MTQTSTVPTPDLVRTRTSRARTGIIVVMVVALVVAAVTRDWAVRKRIETSGLPGGAAASSAAARSSLGSMNSFSLALLLGGLRGPLVMFLWSTSESQKADKNLEDFDTKVEWIRLLQPEFDTVHIFQIWNKAYNISVQMASLRNKYTTILDALEYSKNVQKGRPDNINLIVSTAQVYSDKLGNSAEKAHYKAWVRQETLPHAPRQRIKRGDPAWRPLELDPMLNADGNILPELVTPTRTPPAGHTGAFNDGSELQYLKKYQPFRYGLSPMALAFNYYKQAQVLQREFKQKHAQLSDLVIDSRPGLTLKQWAEDEMDRGRRAEIAAYGMTAPTDINDKIGLEQVSVTLPAGKTGDRAQIDAAVDAYALSAVTADDSVAEYEEHLKLFPNNAMTYESHIDNLVGTREMALADRAFLLAQGATGKERDDLIATARKHYRDAADQNYRILLRYYISDEMAAKYLPPGLMRTRIKDLPADQLARAYTAARGEITRMEYDPYAEDRQEYETYIHRAETRLQQLGK